MKTQGALEALKTIALVGVFSLPLIAAANDIEPRRWTPLPTKMSIVALGYGYTNGDLFFDPVLQVSDAEVKVDTVASSYIHSFSIAGKAARFDLLVPWQSAQWKGLLQQMPVEVNRKGLADPRFRLSVNLSGPPTSSAKTLRDYSLENPVYTVLGAAISVSVPWGKYHPDKLLNLGQNRYTIRPQIGVVHNRGPWSFELTGSVFLYTDNDDFYIGNRREQKSLYALQTHVVRVFKPGIWGSLSMGYAKSGESTIDGVAKNDKREQLLKGISLGYSLTKRQSVKVSYITSDTLEDIGADTHTLALIWTMVL